MKQVKEEPEFFSTQSDSSRVKAQIVSEYFLKWAMNRIVTIEKSDQPDQSIMYLDLFSGPGRYDNGESSTPLMVLEQIRNNPKIKEHLHCAFNDGDPAHIESLKKNIANLNLTGLASEPEFRTGMVDSELAAYLSKQDLENTLMFVDPFGYKGLSLDLLDCALKSYGTDVIFFLNFNRLRMALNNQLVQSHVEAIFGAEGCKLLKAGAEFTSDKEELMLNSLFGSLRARKWHYFSIFKFLSDSKDDTSHFLIMVSKHPRAFEYMQRIMSKHSSHIDNEGFHSFTFEPKTSQMALTLVSKTATLANDLHLVYAGKRRRLDEIYHEYGPGRPYVRADFVQAVHWLHAQGMVSFEPKVPRRGTCSDSCTIKFEVT